MTRSAIAFLALALVTAAPAPAAAQSQSEAGTLTCQLKPTIGLIIGSRQRMTCVFSIANTTRRETYAGSITRLREVAKVAPQALPQIGRAWLEDLLGQATKERGGGFHFTESLYNRWAKLGPDTKALLFKNPQHIQDLDNFFLLSKKLGERVNPSGTAMLTAKGAEALSLAKQVMDPGVGLLYTIGAPVVAKLLLSPTTTRFLLQGLRLPVGATAARTLWGQRLAALLAQPESGLVSHGIPAPQTSKE